MKKPAPRSDSNLTVNHFDSARIFESFSVIAEAFF